MARGLRGVSFFMRVAPFLSISEMMDTVTIRTHNYPTTCSYMWFIRHLKGSFREYFQTLLFQTVAGEPVISCCWKRALTVYSRAAFLFVTMMFNVGKCKAMLPLYMDFDVEKFSHICCCCHKRCCSAWLKHTKPGFEAPFFPSLVPKCFVTVFLKLVRVTHFFLTGGLF